MDEPAIKKWRFLPPVNTPQYHLLLSAVAIFILGPLGGVCAAYMNFSVGFFVGGQVLAGILGSAVTYGYGSEGKHGANYMQSMAASVAGLAGMAIIPQAMVWMGMTEPPVWQELLFLTCVGMFGVGVGMLYTPILVDRMRLTFPSGLAVANILRALTDPALLRRSIAKLGGGTLVGIVSGIAATQSSFLGDTMEISASTFGAGMIVGARIALPAAAVAALGVQLTPWFRANGWLGPHDPFRKFLFVPALGTILGAAIIDLTVIGWQAWGRWQEKKPAAEQEQWQKVSLWRLVLWVVVWGAALAWTASSVLDRPIGFVLLGIGLVFVFLMINGICDGISDWNPISSAFVLAVLLMALLGLKDPRTGLICASILLIACGVGVDMQQDRSTGWRLGTNRVIQFRYQVIGIAMGAVMAVVMARVFMRAYPALAVNTYLHPETPGASKWNAAMTFKVVGSLDQLAHPNRWMMKALGFGIGLGLFIELVRKLVRGNAGWRRFAKSGWTGWTVDFIFDAVVFASPYASSTGGFLSLPTSLWFAGGGVFSSLWDSWDDSRRKKRAGGGEELPSDMSTTSLVGGGLIAGDSLAALGLAIFSLLSKLAGS